MSANPETSPGKIIARIAAGTALTISAGHDSAGRLKVLSMTIAPLLGIRAESQRPGWNPPYLLAPKTNRT